MRWKHELEAWWKQTNRARVVLTRGNVRSEFIKMWIQRRKERIAKRRIELKGYTLKKKGVGKKVVSGKTVKKWGGKESKFREEVWNWERERRREARIHRQSITWTQKELRQKVEVEAWFKKSQVKGVKLTRKNVGKEYKKMWAWIRAQRQASRKARVENRWTWNELRLKAEIEAWRTHMKIEGVALTRDNIVAEYKKMWSKKRVYLKTAWTKEEIVMKQEIDVWLKQHPNLVGEKLNRVNVRTKFKEMWESIQKADKKGMTIVQMQKRVKFMAWFGRTQKGKNPPTVTKSNIDKLYAWAVKQGLKATIIDPSKF